MAKIVIFKSLNDGQHYYHVVARNGEIISQSEGYRSRWGARRGAKRFIKLVSGAELVEEY